MAQVARDAQSQRRTQNNPAYRKHSRWTGWVHFAGVLLLLIGSLNIVDGLVALLNSDWYVVTETQLLTFDFTAWGWILLLFGVAQLAAGLGVMSGNMAARVAGTVFAALNAISHLAFIDAYPAWSVLAIAIDIVVIYALTAHGRDVVEA